MGKLRFSIIVPCLLLPDKDHELLRFTRACVDSVREWFHDYELILVDNGSSVDGDYLREQADVYVRNRTNLGYGPAVNQGMKIARGEWIVVANNDLEFIEPWGDTAVDAWNMATTGIMSSHLHGSDPEHRAGRGVYSHKHFCGALWMVHKSIPEIVGHLDEGYERGMWEDKDYALRIQEVGLEHVKVGWVKHVGNATWGKLPNQQEVFIKNREYFDGKWPRSRIRAIKRG